MPTNISITGITGTSPYHVYVCDYPETTCIYVDTISSVPYSFDIPVVFDGQTFYTLKIIDNNNIIATQIL